MWNPFRKKAAPPPPDRIKEMANEMFRSKRLQELEAELEKIDRATLTEPELASWWHIYGIEAFRTGREGEATRRFEEGHRLFPQSPLLRFSLGQQYVRARRLDEGFRLLSGCAFPGIPREHAFAVARYAYLWNRYDIGRAALRPFVEAYKSAKILDDHYLWTRGLPFFGTWWSSLAALSFLAKDTRELEEVTDWATKHGSDYDFDLLTAQFEAYRDGRIEPVLKCVESRLAQIPPGVSSAYLGMMRAVLKGSEALLQEVVVGKNDHDWLNDIRTLARAEFAYRSGNAAAEEDHLATFLARQPMLFEPNHALNFHLLHYQERLKARIAATPAPRPS